MVRHRVVRVIFEYVFVSSSIYYLMILIMTGVLMQSGLNMLTIQLGKQRVLLNRSQPGRHVSLFFLLVTSDRLLSLRDPASVV